MNYQEVERMLPSKGRNEGPVYLQMRVMRSGWKDQSDVRDFDGGIGF